MDALKSLLGMKSISNVGSYAGAPGALDVISAERDLMPGEAELKAAQAGVREGTGIGVSRQELQDGAMSGLRRTLGMADRDVRRKTDAEAELMDREAGHAMDRQQLASQTQLHSTQIAANSRAEQAEAAAAAKENALAQLLGGAGGNRSVSVSGVGSVGAPPRAQAAQSRPMPQGLLKQIQDAEANVKGQILPGMQRMLGMDTGETQHLSALQAGLESRGDLDGIENAIRSRQPNEDAEMFLARLQEQVGQLDPYEAAYIRLRLAQGQ